MTDHVRTLQELRHFPFCAGHRPEHNGAAQSKNQKKMRTPGTPQDIAELSRLWEEYQRAMVFALEIIRTDGTNAATFPKIRAQHQKACRTMELIRGFYGLSMVRR